MNRVALDDDIKAEGLSILGDLPVSPSDPVPEGTRSILMLGPDEPNFWKIFKDSKEYKDKKPDPLDRWSKRIIDNIAKKNNCAPLYPFGGEPYKPFYSWALRSGTVWSSPVHLAIHKDRGLFVSFRGALAVQENQKSEDTFESPCAKCPAPCLTACPVDAFTETGYDVLKCKSHISDLDSSNCKSLGCKTRRSCPVGADFREFEQSAFHMENFLR